MNERNFVSADELGKAAYGGFYHQYGHAGGAKNLNEAWEWIGEDQRKVWRASADAVIQRLNEARKAA